MTTLLQEMYLHWFAEERGPLLRPSEHKPTFTQIEATTVTSSQGLDDKNSADPNGCWSTVRRNGAVRRAKMHRKIVARLLTSLIIVGASSPAMAAHWGEFRDDGIQDLGNGRKVRVYQAILWDIPWGHSWEDACANKPADINGIHFDRPTACAKSSILQPISAILAGVRLASLSFPPLGVAAAVASVGTSTLNLSGAGALNMWGIFYVNQ